MLAILVELGFTDEQAQKVIDVLGIEVKDDLKFLTEKDLVERLGMKPVPARRILVAAGVTPSVDSSPREIVVRLDRGDIAVADMLNPEDLLAVLTATGRSLFDKKAAASKLVAMGRSVVVKKDARKELLTNDTVAFWRLGSSRSLFWGPDDNPVVGALSLFETDERVEIDPYELVHGRRLVSLVDGLNSESGANWAKVPNARRALLIAAAYDREAIASGDAVDIAVALSADTLSGKWKVLESRLDKARLTKLEGCLTAPLADIQTPDSEGASALIVAVFGQREDRQEGFSVADVEIWKSPEGLLCDFFLSAFSADELRCLIPSPAVSNSLPGSSVSSATLASSLVQTLKGHGYTKSRPHFWDLLLKQRPGWANEIRFLAGKFNVSM